jgi:bacteriochlorophyllide a dehydrogenase
MFTPTKSIHPSLLRSKAMVFHGSRDVALTEVELNAPGPNDVMVQVAWSGVSTGTERLLWDGSMPSFPGMGYPLVPGYESVGMVIGAPKHLEKLEGKKVFVPGARCYAKVHGLFGASASRLLVDSERICVLPDGFDLMAPHSEPVLLALAATAHHMMKVGYEGLKQADSTHLIVGHGVLGRLLARTLVACGHKAPVVWELNPNRRDGAVGYTVTAPKEKTSDHFHCIWDVSGDMNIVNTLIPHLKPGGRIVLGGFYPGSIAFDFAPAFMREAQILIAAQWQPADLTAAIDLVIRGRLSLGDLITNHAPVADAASAYQTAFQEAECLKLVFHWGQLN